ARVVRRVVQALLRLREQIQPREEEGHVRAVLLGEVQEAREQPVADLTGPVPGADDELRRGRARLQRHRLVGLVGLLAGEGGGAVTDRPDGPARLGIRRAGTAAAGTAGPVRAVRSREAAAAGQRDGGRGAGTAPEHSPAGETAHGIPDRHACRWSLSQRPPGAGRFPAKCGDFATNTADRPRERGTAPAPSRTRDTARTFTADTAELPRRGNADARGPRLRGPRADRRRTGRTTCCLLRAACCLLPAACCLLPAACCLLPAAVRRLRRRTPCPCPSPAWHRRADGRARGRGPARCSRPRRSGRPGR